MANPKGHYMVDGSSSSDPTHQVQAITTLRSGKVVDNNVEEKKNEQNRPAKKLNVAKDKGVNNETPFSATPTPETSYEPRAPFPERLKEPPCVGKQGDKFQEMMEIFKQVKINIPIIDAIR
jgi:hypothetical protein